MHDPVRCSGCKRQAFSPNWAPVSNSSPVGISPSDKKPFISDSSKISHPVLDVLHNLKLRRLPLSGSVALRGFRPRGQARNLRMCLLKRGLQLGIGQIALSLTGSMRICRPQHSQHTECNNKCSSDSPEPCAGIHRAPMPLTCHSFACTRHCGLEIVLVQN